ncbi:MAG: hypothetical protein RMK29_08380 [Myxococcales bacterium]|nr:hypothetical protein [Myxococcota bacterium]MDW8281711.1 hypothetical protein [Myxococcales bacterium]
MRSSVAYLVVLMIMLAVFASVRLNPLEVIALPGNLVLCAALIVGAVAVVLRRPWSYAVGLGAALLTALGGVLSLRAWLGTNLPGHPVVWIVAGLYIAFRLTLNRHAEEETRRRLEDRCRLRLDEPPSPGG